MEYLNYTPPYQIKYSYKTAAFFWGYVFFPPCFLLALRYMEFFESETVPP